MTLRSLKSFPVFYGMLSFCPPGCTNSGGRNADALKGNVVMSVKRRTEGELSYPLLHLCPMKQMPNCHLCDKSCQNFAIILTGITANLLYEMESGRENEIEDMESLQIAGSSGFRHNVEFMSQSFRRSRSSEIDIEDEPFSVIERPLAIFLKFEDVEYKVRITKASHNNPVKAAASKKDSNVDIEQEHYKYILKGITGSIAPGEILALMGPSGSGKTTLLKVVGGRLQDNVNGNITYNGVPYNPGVKRRSVTDPLSSTGTSDKFTDPFSFACYPNSKQKLSIYGLIGFVTQDDVLFPQLTVEETLLFAAYLRHPKSMSTKEKYDRVQLIIKELGLERCRHTRIGGGLVKGISGGERKRTSIGYEILVDPSLLLLDEPTSGLDSTSANKLLQILQGVAQGGRTLITTIHQPSSRMFHMFNKILVIAEGYPVYYGKARDAMQYFSTLSFIPEIPMNPAEFLLDLATGQFHDISVPDDVKNSDSLTMSEKAVVQYLHIKYKTLLEPKEKGADPQSAKLPEDIQIAIQVKKEWTMSWWEQFVILFKRTFRQRRRDYFDTVRLVQAIGVAVLLGLLWWKSKNGTEAQLRDQIGLMFYICIFWTSASIFGAVYVFPFEKLYLVKERKAGMYRLSAYYACSTLSDMLAHVLYPTIFMVIVYFMAGLKRTLACFFQTLFTILLIAITSQGAGELFGAAVLSIKRAGTIASLVLMLFLLAGGYYVQHIPRFMKWLKYISFMFYGFRLLLKVQYSGDQLYECESVEGCRKLQTSPSFDTVNLGGGLREVWVLLTMALAYRLCAYVCLRWRISSHQI
ncbi:ABC transporter G family member 26-like protein [Drosera capensis]